MDVALHRTIGVRDLIHEGRIDPVGAVPFI